MKWKRNELRRCGIQQYPFGTLLQVFRYFYHVCAKGWEFMHDLYSYKPRDPEMRSCMKRAPFLLIPFLLWLEQEWANLPWDINKEDAVSFVPRIHMPVHLSSFRFFLKNRHVVSSGFHLFLFLSVCDGILYPRDTEEMLIKRCHEGMDCSRYNSIIHLVFPSLREQSYIPQAYFSYWFTVKGLGIPWGLHER